VRQIHTSLLGANHDGFLFLRNVLGKFVPVFCPYKDSKAPTWRKTPDVAHMAKLWKLHFKLNRKTGSIHTPIQQSLMFLQSLKDPSLSANVTSVRGQIQLFTESIDAFDDSPVDLPTNLTIDGITTTLTAFPSPIETSISFATANRYTIFDSDSDDDEFIEHHDFFSNATTFSRSNNRSGQGSSRKPKTSHKEDKKETAKDIVCRGCHKKGHKEVDCRELAKWLIISGAVKKLKDSVRTQVLENYHRHYSSEPPSKRISKSSVDQLRAFCSEYNTTPTQVVMHYDWKGYIGADLTEDDEGFETAAEGEEESN
jgi:hypothetical protein